MGDVISFIKNNALALRITTLAVTASVIFLIFPAPLVTWFVAFGLGIVGVLTFGLLYLSAAPEYIFPLVTAIIWFCIGILFENTVKSNQQQLAGIWLALFTLNSVLGLCSMMLLEQIVD